MIKQVPAAGGLVWRIGADGPEILLIHRDRYSDWTFPKGKLDQGETDVEAALREVEEETGYHCQLGIPAGANRYPLQSGKAKRVVYFTMEAVSGSFVPNDEVDEITWATASAARRILTYDHDRELLDALVPDWWKLTGRLHLVRHAQAGKRKDQDGSDRKRPLSERGRQQAEAIAEFLLDQGVERLLTSPYVRCTQTFEPAAEMLDIELEVHDGLAEGSSAKKLEKLLQVLGDTPTALCTHGDMIPAVLERLAAGGTSMPKTIDYPKGSVWTIDVRDGSFPAAHYTAPMA